MRLLKFFLPLALFIGLAIFLGLGLNKDPREIPSPLIGKSAPTFALPSLEVSSTGATEGAQWTPTAMNGKVWLLNIWGSWCAGCLTEHPLLAEIAKVGSNPELIGIAWKDAPSASGAWLNKHGNPYKKVVIDRAGKVAIDYGVYGAPETFLIDKKGIVRAKHIGPLTQDAWEKRLKPLADQLQKES
jgi:cytochrome c biogenesis protein CcmG, thiol:disulfide interchange protein DsbE